MTYQTEIQKTSSEKYTVVHIHASQRLAIFTLDSGSIYKRNTDYFVNKVYQNGTLLTQAASASLSSGEYFYDIPTGDLYLNTTDDSDPSTKTIVVEYRFFISDKPCSLPCDLASGQDVYYEGIFKSNSSINKEVDTELIGIAVESSTTLNLINDTGFFDDTYDVLVWENKDVKIYSGVNGAFQLIFDGVIQNKSFSDKQVSFKCQDLLFKLRQPLLQDFFSESDGTILDAYIGKPKRTLFGQFKKLSCTPLDSVVDGYSLTGTATVSAASTTLTGTGTAFLDEVSPNDKISAISSGGNLIELGVSSVDSDTQITLSSAPDESIVDGSFTNKPEYPWRKKNRVWHIAGHKLRAPSTTVDVGFSESYFSVVSSEDILPNDTIYINGEAAKVLRVSGNNITLLANLQGGTPSNGDAVIKNPVSKAYILNNEAFINRDFTVTNTTECKIILEEDAELNIAKDRSISGSFTFTNGSRDVTVTGVDLLNFLKPRDWIKSGDITHTTLYEILSVSETSLELRVNYAGSNYTGTAKIRIPDVLDDDGIVTVDCVGKESLGKWINTASRAVKELLTVDIGLTNIDTDSFDESHESCFHTLSIASPKEIGDDQEIVRDVIDKINNSVFGSLSNNVDWDLSYNVYDQKKPSDLSVLTDSDIIDGPKVSSQNDIVRKVNARYSFFTDTVTGESAFDLYEWSSDFVDNLVGVTNELNIDLYLFNESSAKIMAQRWALFRSLSQSNVTITTDLRTSQLNLGDKVYLDLDRLYKRFGNRDSLKIGVVTSISRDSSNMEITFSDHGNTYSRIGNISSNTTNVFSSASGDEKVKSGFIVDNSLGLPENSSDNEMYQNLIG